MLGLAGQPQEVATGMIGDDGRQDKPPAADGRRGVHDRTVRVHPVFVAGAVLTVYGKPGIGG